jgi:hypothetical protein
MLAKEVRLEKSIKKTDKSSSVSSKAVEKSNGKKRFKHDDLSDDDLPILDF